MWLCLKVHRTALQCAGPHTFTGTQAACQPVPHPPVFLQAVLGGGGAGVPGQVVSVSASCKGREGSSANCVPLAAERDSGAAYHAIWRWSKL